MQRLKLKLVVFTIPLFGCGLRQALDERSYGMPGVDYGPKPTNYETTVTFHLQHTYDQEPTSDEWDQWMGPFEGSIQKTRDGDLETVFGWEIHVWYGNTEIHYMVLIRDGKIAGSENCGSLSGGFGLLDFRKPSCYTGR
jgi:hypothetical protein